MNARVADEIEKRLQPGDVVGIISGRCQESLYHQFKDRAKVVEWGIGYEGVVTDYRVFESWAWAHHVAGLRHENPIRYWDAVIPNSYDAEDFTPSYEPGSYLFYMARPTPNKGMQIVRAIAKHTNMPIVTAGQGGSWLEGADHRGVVLREEKAALLAGAAALLSPTIYLEPFGGVTIEAMLSGTPVITTDWGVYTETVQNGSNGYRCRTLREFLDAVEKVQTLDRHQVRRAGERYLTTNVRHEYNTYFERLATLDGGGWNQL
jgi:glycosyltransferase involved in cell wall biosynthesis